MQAQAWPKLAAWAIVKDWIVTLFDFGSDGRVQVRQMGKLYSLLHDEGEDSCQSILTSGTFGYPDVETG